jgi:zinc protease
MTTTIHRGLAPHRTVLDNGTVVIVKENRTSPAVTLNAAFHAGTVHDEVPHIGLSHFLSRVIDRGTVTRSADVIAEELDRRGVSLGVSAARHLFTFSCTCLAEDLEAVLGLLGDVAMNPTLPAEEVETRRGEIITAIRQDEDNPAAVAVEGLLSLLYPEPHPYGRRVKGTAETVDGIDREALERFHRARFGPASLSLVMVGDLDAGRAAEAAARVFGDWSSPTLPAPSVPRAAAAATRRRLTVTMMNKAQADIACGFVSIARLDPCYHAFWLMNNTLGQYALGGRLGDSIRERQGMAYYVFSTFDASVVEGPLIVRAGVDPANVERAVASIDEELAKMAGEGVTERELEESKLYLVGSLPRSFETNAGVAAFLQTVEQYGLGLDYDVRLPGLIEAVTLEEVNETARKFIAPDRATIVVAGPCSA